MNVQHCNFKTQSAPRSNAIVSVSLIGIKLDSVHNQDQSIWLIDICWLYNSYFVLNVCWSADQPTAVYCSCEFVRDQTI